MTPLGNFGFAILLPSKGYEIVSLDTEKLISKTGWSNALRLPTKEAFFLYCHGFQSQRQFNKPDRDCDFLLFIDHHNMLVSKTTSVNTFSAIYFILSQITYFHIDKYFIS